MIAKNSLANITSGSNATERRMNELGGMIEKRMNKNILLTGEQFDELKATLAIMSGIDYSSDALVFQLTLMQIAGYLNTCHE